MTYYVFLMRAVPVIDLHKPTLVQHYFVCLGGKEFSVSFMASSICLTAEGRSCSSVMFTLPSILSAINHTGPQGPHNSNETPCQSITALILRTGVVSKICWVVEVNLYSHPHSWDLASIASVMMMCICFVFLKAKSTKRCWSFSVDTVSKLRKYFMNWIHS